MDNPARLLLVDDEEVFLLSTADLLRQEGYQVDCAMDGLEATQRLRTVPYDLLIADIRMPGNPDLDLIQNLPEPNQGLPVILMTGYPSARTAILAVNLSVLAYLVKPMEFTDLLGQVRRGVTQRRIQLAAQVSARRVQDWGQEMGRLASEFGSALPRPGGMPVQHLLGAMLGRMGETLLDMKNLLDLSAKSEVSDQACSVQNCPRLEAYEHLFREGIDILEKTKGAFKSRNLEDLRHKMESAVSR